MKRRTTINLVLACVFSLFTARPVPGDTWYVDQNGPQDRPGTNQATAVELQYLDNGQWRILSHQGILNTH